MKKNSAHEGQPEHILLSHGVISPFKYERSKNAKSEEAEKRLLALPDLHRRRVYRRQASAAHQELHSGHQG